MPPMITADTLLTNAHGAVIATRPASRPLAIMLGIGLAVPHPHVEHRRERAGRAGQHRVDRDDADAQVAARERGARVEAEPAERQDEGAGDAPSACRGRASAVGSPSLVVLADARAEHDRAGERRDAAHHVHDRRAGEVDVPVAEAEVRAERARASRRPRPSWRTADRRTSP